MWSFIKSIPRSVIAFAITLALGLLSMGLLGAGLYVIVSFALPSSFPHIDSIGGDWVWPAVILVGMAWSFGFLIAGSLNKALVAKALAPITRRAVYLVVLWCWAYVLWIVALYARTA
jgi:hypothetical protein